MNSSPMNNGMAKVPAHLVSLAGEYGVRMTVDPRGPEPLAPKQTAADDARPLAVVELSMGDMAGLRSLFGYSPRS